MRVYVCVFACVWVVYIRPTHTRLCVCFVGVLRVVCVFYLVCVSKCVVCGCGVCMCARCIFGACTCSVCAWCARVECVCQL